MSGSESSVSIVETSHSTSFRLLLFGNNLKQAYHFPDIIVIQLFKTKPN